MHAVLITPACLDEYTWRELPPRARPLEDRIEEDKDSRRNDPLYQANAEMRERERPLDGETQFLQPVSNSFGMKIKIKFDELNRLQSKRTPLLSAEQVAENRLEI